MRSAGAPERKKPFPGGDKEKKLTFLLPQNSGSGRHVKAQIEGRGDR